MLHPDPHHYEWRKPEKTGAFDFTKGNLTTDGTWRVLDLSSIVPKEAVAAIFRVSIEDDLVNSKFRMRGVGQTDVYQIFSTRTIASNTVIDSITPPIPVTDQKIEYYGDNVSFTTIEICVLSWYVQNV